METRALENANTVLISPVDDSRPFRSVKEAVAIFGDQLLSPPKFSFDKDKHLVLEEQHIDSSMIIQSPVKTPNSPTKFSRFGLKRQASDSSLVTQSPYNSGKQSVGSSEINEPKPSPQNSENERHNGNVVHGNDLVMMLMVLKKLEADLKETKMELKMLKEQESETQISLASLNAELHVNMAKIAKAEATVAAAAVAKSSMESPKGEKRDVEKERMEMMIKSLDSPTLAQILSISDYERYIGGSKKNSSTLMKKKKPIIPLVTDFFVWKKKSSPNNEHLSPLFPAQLYSS